MEKLELGELKGLTVQHFDDTLGTFFSMVDDLKITGETPLGAGGLLVVLDRWPRLRSVSVSAKSKIVYPLSKILESRFNAPLERVSLQGYQLHDLFSVRFLDNLL